MHFETLRFFFIPWKIPENLLFDNGQQITKGKQKHPVSLLLGNEIDSIFKSNLYTQKSASYTDAKSPFLPYAIEPTKTKTSIYLCI